MRSFDGTSTTFSPFPPTSSHYFVSVDILRPLPRSRMGCQYVVIFTDLYSKLTCAIPVGKMSRSYVTSTISENWFIAYQIRNYLLVENCPQLLAKLFDKLSLDLRMEHHIATAYHSQTHGHVGCYNKSFSQGYDTALPATKEYGTNTFNHFLTLRKRK